MKKIVTGIAALSMAALLLAGCGAGPGEGFNPSIGITVVSREEGSGTRGAFVELFGIAEKQEDGATVDLTTVEAITINSTAVMMNTVSGDPYAIGYISLGALNDTVKAVQIDGTPATVENIKNRSYTISRPFNIATLPQVSEVAADFIGYILSAEGQAVVEAASYIPLDGAEPYAGTRPRGKVVVAGSSSVAPVMEKLKEAYLAVNTGAEIEIQQSDSSTGMSAALEGICDIGMASRELKDSELKAGLASTVIALDGIAVIVNLENPIESLSSAQVRSIFTGTETTWAEVE